MRHALLTLLAVTSLAAVLTLNACTECQEFIGTTTVENPAEETPEWVIEQAIVAAMQEDTDDGWKIIRPLLHSKITGSAGAESSFRTLNFESFHRKWKLYTVGDDSKPIFEIDKRDTDDRGNLRIFVLNEGSDMPTPCRLNKDPAQGGKWRIAMCSL
ncbi:MAG: hypothetical protein ACI9MR_001002 [Myxococcota bacterium]|jgi:hypothetical protein